MKPEDLLFKGENIDAQKAEYFESIKKKYPHTHVIARKVKLGRDGNTFNPNMRDPKKEIFKPVETDYVMLMNEQWTNSGAWFEIDKEASEKWNEDHKKWKEEVKFNDEVKREASENLGNALTELTKIGRKNNLNTKK